MFDLNTFHTINDRVKKYKEDFRLHDLGGAFIWLCLETILSLSEDEIEDAITDGSLDGGIDAIYIEGRNVHIFNFKYAEKYETSRYNFPENEIPKIIHTIDSILTKTVRKNAVNDALWDKIEQIWELFNEGKIELKFYLCSNKRKLVDRAKNDFENSLDKYKYTQYFYYDQEDLVAKILEKKYKKIDGKFQFVDRQYFDRSDGGIKGVVATVEAVELLKLVTDPENSEKINEDVFNDNVRIYLKLSNQINKRIFQTALADDNFIFWYLNNGVTIICDECIYQPNTTAPQVTLVNYQIANGGQTTHALFEAFQNNPDKIRNVYILIRICETKKDNRIGERISETTNTQTPIRTRDLHANDMVQKKLEEQFLTLGYFYERKKNQHQNQIINKRLDNELLGQIYLSYYLDMPSQAKDRKRFVFGEKYNDIFTDDITAEKLLNPYKAYTILNEKKKDIQKKKRNKQLVDEKEAFISFASFHLLNAVKIVAEHEKLHISKENDIDIAIQKAILYVQEIVNSEISKHPNIYKHDKFFKEPSTQKIIENYIIKKYTTNVGNNKTLI